MSDDEEETDSESPGILERSLNYIRGRAQADQFKQFKKLKSNPKPELDDEKVKNFKKSFMGN